MLNIINGGAHANNSLQIQEFMIRPDGAKPIISDRDFTIATIAAPTVVKEPEPAAGYAAGCCGEKTASNA